MNENGNFAPGYSIIIPVYNGEKTLPDTLRSVTGLDHESFEIIVVDDGSADGSAELARSQGTKVLCLGDNRGPANARNQGAKQAVYDKLLFTDSDVLLQKSLLKLLDRRFRESDADAVQGTFSDVCPFGNYYSQYKNLYNRFVLNHLPDWIDTTFTSVTAVKQSAFVECGGFDANIRGASVEDRTLGKNLVNHGYRIRLDRDLEVIHNKKLTFQGFLLNQYRRSHDLAKLLLRNRSEMNPQKEEDTTSFYEKGRFGTNSIQTMIRIPAAYCIIGLFVLHRIDLAFGLLAILFFLMFLGLVWPLEWELFKRRGLYFALIGIPVNFLDALISGAGIGIGVLEYFVLGKKY